MGHEKQVAMAMQAFFSSQFASADPSNYAGPNEYVPEVKGEAKLEVIDNPFGDNKAPPGRNNPRLYDVMFNFRYVRRTRETTPAALLIIQFAPQYTLPLSAPISFVLFLLKLFLFSESRKKR